ncbi:hypothetical protein ACHAXT_009174 [Thalassiosira profunda]
MCQDGRARLINTRYGFRMLPSPWSLEPIVSAKLLRKIEDPVRMPPKGMSKAKTKHKDLPPFLVGVNMGIASSIKRESKGGRDNIAQIFYNHLPETLERNVASTNLKHVFAAVARNHNAKPHHVARRRGSLFDDYDFII